MSLHAPAWQGALENQRQRALRTAVAVRVPGESASEFEDGCNAWIQPGDSTDEDGQPLPLPPQRSAVADPLPARVRWPVPQDQECVGSEPRVTLVKGNPPRRVREHHLLQKRQKAATKARVEKLLLMVKSTTGTLRDMVMFRNTTWAIADSTFAVSGKTRRTPKRERTNGTN